MTPFEYIKKIAALNNSIHSELSEISEQEFKKLSEERKKLWEQAKSLFPLFEETINKDNHIVSFHDGYIQSLSMNKTGILHIKTETTLYDKNTNEQESGYQITDIYMNILKLPEGGMSLSRQSIILNMEFTDNEFAIEFLPKNNHSSSLIESYDISAIDISHGSFIQYNRNKKTFKSNKKNL